MTDLLGTVTQFLQAFFFGHNSWILFLAIGIAVIAGIFLRRGFKPKVEVQEAAPDIPTAEEYLKNSIEDESISQSGEPKQPQVGSPTPQPKERQPLQDRAAIYDPSMEKISLAFDSAKERMIDEFASAITRMKFKITLPEEGRPLKVETQPQTETPPTEGE